MLIDVGTLSDSNIRKKKHEKLEKYQGLKEEVEDMWGVKAAVVPMVIRALGVVTHKLGPVNIVNIFLCSFISPLFLSPLPFPPSNSIVLIPISIYLSIYLSIYMCACVCV